MGIVVRSSLNERMKGWEGRCAQESSVGGGGRCGREGISAEIGHHRGRRKSRRPRVDEGGADAYPSGTCAGVAHKRRRIQVEPARGGAWVCCPVPIEQLYRWIDLLESNLIAVDEVAVPGQQCGGTVPE